MYKLGLWCELKAGEKHKWLYESCLTHVQRCLPDKSWLIVLRLISEISLWTKKKNDQKMNPPE